MAKKKMTTDGLFFVGMNAQEVTGSCIYGRFGDKQFLLECGMHQSSTNSYLDAYKVNSAKFKFNPKEIDYVFLNHAHIDHSGLTPRLVKEGFKGKIICTYETSVIIKDLLLNSGINPENILNVITVDSNNIGTTNFYSSYIVSYAFLFIIMAITVSATYPATDTTAGEKERGTLETLLTFPIKSRDIIVGKFLSVSLSSIITGIVSLILMLISLAYANGAFEIYKDTNLMLSTSSLIFTIVVIIAYSLLVSGLCIAIASKSKTFKEAQSALTPLTFICFFPGMIAFMAGINSSPLLSLVPFLNFTLLFQDIVVGNIDIVNILLMSLSTIVIITIVLVVIIKQYKSEKVLF